MNFKSTVFILLAALLLAGSTKYDVFAADTETDIAESDYVDDSESGSDTVFDIAPLLESLESNRQELVSIQNDLRNVCALLLILVTYETLRIVRSWSKGVGVK